MKQTVTSDSGTVKSNLPTNRNFGFVFTAFFSFLAFGPAFLGHAIRWPFALMAIIFLALTLVNPAILSPLNRAWFRFGTLLHKVMSPVILALIFYAVFTPMGWMMRQMGKDPLHMDWDEKSKSYWITKDKIKSNMKDQF